MNAIARILLVLFILLLSVLLAIYGGFTLSMLWHWFVIPTFSAPELSIPAAIGIGYIALMLTYVPNFTQKTENDGTTVFVAATIFNFFKISICLFFGYIVQLFM